MPSTPRTPDAPFVGRSEALERLEVYRRERALVVVTGPPGVGKTRLLEEAGAEPVRLAGAATIEEAWAALAQTWGAAEERRAAFEAAFAEAPAPLVLDAPAAPYAAALLEALLALPDARVVVASRTRPGLAGEQVLELGPLARDDAAALLLELVERVRGAPPKEDERAWAAEVAEAAGRLPLALELCAGRARLLGLRALHHRLRAPLAALGPSLEASLLGSWEALEDEEQVALARLAPLAGPAPADALEALLVAGELPGLELLGRLRERSLLVGGEVGLALPRPVAALAARERAEDAERGRVALAEALAARPPCGWGRREAHALAREVGERSAAPAPLAGAVVRALVAQALVGPSSAALEALVEPLVEVTARSGASVELVGWAHLLRSRARAARGDAAGAETDRRAATTLAAKGAHAALLEELALGAAEEAAARGERGEVPPEPADPARRRRWRWLRASAEEDAETIEALAGEADAVGLRARRWLAARRGEAGWLESVVADAGPAEAREALAALVALAEREGRARLWEARRLAEQLGDAAKVAALDARLRAEPAASATLVVEDGLARRGEEVVDVRRRPTLRRVLAALVERRVAAPGEALAWDALLEAGWPGQKVRAESGAHRVRVAVSTLRKLGLADVIETVEEGYRLDPEVPVDRSG
ncbi:MAG TPA: hypothetical protein RMH85_08695 [Polyangiaceae bacterium LLY-WYZ-15_(1-7)]|nr:hypothetical protein [Sandaracinus sp.]MBJ70885.1 hypothetical protein [Sandaracinus sp.]HJL01420.1 hypothetical protein [Polyangiaceae bacterium LLY-WYZ-15_(1-7)]HJL08561.1 hypothetical protein [Polyangiaceae bacterium LLY-WYZ-15_(1-7)]